MPSTAIKTTDMLLRPEFAPKVLDGTKSMTRRIINPQPIDKGDGCWEFREQIYISDEEMRDHLWNNVYGAIDGDPAMRYGGIYEGYSDLLRFLTTWGMAARYDNRRPLDMSDSAKVWTAFDGPKPSWCGKSRPGRFMPLWMRSKLPVFELTDVRVERVQDISEADAIAEGFDQDTCWATLDAAAGRVQSYPACWLRHDQKSCDGYFCHKCAAKKIKELGEGWTVGGTWNDFHESDGPSFCDKCQCVIDLSLTEYGIDRELFLENDLPENRQHFAARGADARIAATFAGGIGDLQEKHLGRLAQIGFATKWDQINGVGSWAANPWVWVLSFRKVSQ